MFERAAALTESRNILAENDLEPLVTELAADVDADVLRRLRHIHEAGGWVLLESSIADLPSDLRWLYESGAVTIEQLSTLHGALGTTAAIDIAEAVRAKALQKLPGLDAEVEQAVADALPSLRARIPRVSLGRAVATIEPMLSRLRRTEGVEWAAPAGSLRRGEDTVGDIEIVAAAAAPAAAIAEFSEWPGGARVLHRSNRRLYLLLDRLQIGFRFPEPSEAGATLLHMTGSAGHVAALRDIAARRGTRLETNGLFGTDGARLATTEAEIYAALDLAFVAPEIRDGDQEVSRAEKGDLPALVTKADIRGDLHMHTTWSDGRDSVETMVQAAGALGYEYVAITDHSQTSAASRNLSIEGVKRQADEIARMREQAPDIAILHGCEVDILPDGKLDFPDRILQQFDIVLASLHESAGHSRDQLMNRYISAMKHPLVTAITHPTNRLVPHRPGYDLDWDRLFEMAVSTKTVMEIDGAPGHLDMNGALARRAIGAGVMVAIDSDCHRAEMLGRQMELGLTMARRGWVEARQVLKTRALPELRALIARKREG